MEGLSNLGVVKDLLQRHGFTFSKGLGQNFLINPGVCPRMAELGNAQPGWGILEIGPGFGVLTHELAKRADKVVAVEVDPRLPPILQETLGEHTNVQVVQGDVLKLDLRRLIQEQFEGMPVGICANLPYYITSPIVMAVLEQRLPIRSLTVMVQKEAAQRICAQPGTRQVGAVSLAVRYYSEPKVLFSVSRGSFYPAPEVDSSVIRLDIRQTPPVQVQDEALLFRVIRGAFSQRRKTLSNTLSSSLSLPKGNVQELLNQAGVAPTARAEELQLEDFARIADVLALDRKKGEPGASNL